MLLRILAACILLFGSEVVAQEASSTSSQSASTEEQVPSEKPKEQKATTSSATMALSGESAAGSIGGLKSSESINVNSGGAATHSIAITVPPGRASVQPKLSFSYNSEGENSLLGVGWSVSGLPVIHRCARTVAQDGFRGGVNYDGNDRFCLDGQRLMAISGTYGANLTEYRTEIDSFYKIISYGTAGNGPAYFKLWTKGGEMMEFGNSASSAIEAQGKSTIRVWALNKLQDTKGNYLTVQYAEDGANGEYRPTQIDYTGNAAGGLAVNKQVVFEYTGRTDLVPEWVGGAKILTTKLLSNVKTYADSTLVRDYRLAYQTGTASKKSRLTSITECGGDGACLAPNQFGWQEPGSLSYTVQSQVIIANQYSATYQWLGDYDADGKSDLLVHENGSFHTYFSNGNGTYSVVSAAAGTSDWNKDNAWSGDFDGNGRTDLVSYHKNSNKLVTFRFTGNGSYVKTLWGTVASSEFDPLWVWPGDYDGDGRTDILTYKNNNLVY